MPLLNQKFCVCSYQHFKAKSAQTVSKYGKMFFFKRVLDFWLGIH